MHDDDDDNGKCPDELLFVIDIALGTQLLAQSLTRWPPRLSQSVSCAVNTTTRGCKTCKSKTAVDLSKSHHFYPVVIVTLQIRYEVAG